MIPPELLQWYLSLPEDQKQQGHGVLAQVAEEMRRKAVQEERDRAYAEERERLRHKREDEQYALSMREQGYARGPDGKMFRTTGTRSR